MSMKLVLPSISDLSISNCSDYKAQSDSAPVDIDPATDEDQKVKNAARDKLVNDFSIEDSIKEIYGKWEPDNEDGL